MYLLSLMDKPEVPMLKITSPSNCEFILNLYKTYSLEEIRTSEQYYIQKIDYLQVIQCQKEIIWKCEDKLNLLISEQERRLYKDFIQNINLNLNDDNNLDQFDTEYWFND